MQLLKLEELIPADLILELSIFDPVKLMNYPLVILALFIIALQETVRFDILLLEETKFDVISLLEILILLVLI